MSPELTRTTHEAVKEAAVEIVFLDGGIVGGPPSFKKDKEEWYKPAIVVSGPNRLRELQPDGAKIAEILNMKHVSPRIGNASGLKMCYASMTKGLTAIATQVFTTAHALGVDGDLKELLKGTSHGDMVQKGITSCPPKAYRWIDEMKEINRTHAEFDPESTLFNEVARIYQVMTDSELGRETIEERKRGTTTEDVAAVMLEELRKGKEHVNGA